MIIDEYVDILAHGTNVRLLEEMGYNIPRYKDADGRLRIKRGTRIRVKICKEIMTSKERVNCKCDGCGLITNLTLYSYSKNSSKHKGHYYCSKCAYSNKTEKQLKSYYQGKTSFEDWCKDNDHQDYLDLWDYELNDKKPSQFASGSNKKVYFRCPKGIHESSQKILNNMTRNNYKFTCFKCASFEQWCLDNDHRDYLTNWDDELNNVKPSELGYGSRKYVYMKCDRHGSYKTTLNNYINGGRCPICKGNSKGELKIREFLSKNNVEFIQQKRFDDCAYINPLPFDFYIEKLNTCIEYDGKQHFEPIEIFGGNREFTLTKIRDNIKTEYCLNNNIKLIRIPYWEYNNIEQILVKSMQIETFRNSNERKSIPYQWFKDNGILLDYERINFIDYIMS